MHSAFIIDKEGLWKIVNEKSIYDIWIGSYAEPNDPGITRLRLDSQAATLNKTAEFSGIRNPSFLALDKSGSTLYAVSEVEETKGETSGELIALTLAEPGDSPVLKEAASRLTLGAVPCFVMLDPAEKWLAVSNYSGQSAVLYPIGADKLPGPPSVRFRHTGTGPNADRQEAAHPHASVFSPDGNYLFVPDLGIDKIMVYTYDEPTRDWVGHDAVGLAPGAGPRHFRFHPSGRAAFAVNELDNTVTRFAYEPATGTLTRLESLSTLPASFQGETYCAEIAVSPDGRFVYVSNRGHDSIAVFRLDGTTGELQAAGHVSTRGRTPRNFALSPDGAWLVAANQDSDTVVLFRIDAGSGLPVYAGSETSVGKPVCVLFHRAD